MSSNGKVLLLLFSFAFASDFGRYYLPEVPKKEEKGEVKVETKKEEAKEEVKEVKKEEVRKEYLGRIGKVKIYRNEKGEIELVEEER